MPTAREFDPASSGLEKLRYLQLRLLLGRLLQHVGHVVPHPAHINQSGSSSVERAMGASHGATGGACKAAGHAADLVRLRSARRGRHRRSSEQSLGQVCNWCAKGSGFSRVGFLSLQMDSGSFLSRLEGSFLTGQLRLKKSVIEYVTSTPLPDGSYFPIHKITEPAALTRSIAVHILAGSSLSLCQGPVPDLDGQ